MSGFAGLSSRSGGRSWVSFGGARLPTIRLARTGLGLLSLAWGAGEAGRKIAGPMAIVFHDGLATSTLLNLPVLVTLALRFGRFSNLGLPSNARAEG